MTIAQSSQARLILDTAATNYTQTPAFSNGTVHLAIGRIVTGAGTGSVDLWIDPADLSNLPVAPNVSVSGITFPDITRIGVIVNGGSGNGSGRLDALRVSDTATAFVDVTGIPEPASLSLVFVGASLLALRRRRGDQPAHQA